MPLEERKTKAFIQDSLSFDFLLLATTYTTEALAQRPAYTLARCVPAGNTAATAIGVA